MKPVKTFWRSVKRLHPFAKWSFLGCLELSVALYLAAGVIRRVIDYLPDFTRARICYDGLLEAAPATLAVGVIAGLIGDLVLRPRQSDDT